eukprot:scaffold3933_cov64-Phaeocystis_antarctica.AAC.3
MVFASDVRTDKARHCVPLACALRSSEHAWPWRDQGSLHPRSALRASLPRRAGRTTWSRPVRLWTAVIKHTVRCSRAPLRGGGGSARGTWRRVRSQPKAIVGQHGHQKQQYTDSIMLSIKGLRTIYWSSPREPP